MIKLEKQQKEKKNEPLMYIQTIQKINGKCESQKYYDSRNKKQTKILVNTSNGGIPKWLKGPVRKQVDQKWCRGSNPLSSAIL